MFKYAHVIDDDWRDACNGLASRLGTIPKPGSLGFVYAHHAFANDMNRIVAHLRAATAVEHWVGTLGLGVCSTNLEVYDEPSIAVLVTDIPETDFQILPSAEKDLADTAAERQVRRGKMDARFAIVHGDPRNQHIAEVIDALAHSMAEGYLVGGLTSSEHDQVQLADKATEGGLSGVLLSSAVPLATGLSQGCTLIGSKHKITSCQRNILVELDGNPALEVFKKDIGEVLARDLKRISGYIFAALPVSGSDTGDYLVRNIIGIDPDQNLIGIGDLLEPGTTLQFAKRDAQTARLDLTRMVEKLVKRLPGPPKGALYHTCLGRGRNLFGDDSDELKLIGERLPGVPLIGFYANGEISHNRLYGYTGVLTVFC